MEEQYTVSPWLYDDPSKKKIFSLAGFFSSDPNNDMEALKNEVIEKLQKLGGEYLDVDEWDDRITHVITYVDGRKEGMSEKVMGAIAAGRWVLTKVSFSIQGVPIKGIFSIYCLILPQLILRSTS